MREATMARASMSLFDLLKFLALFVCEISRHILMGLSDGLMNAPGGIPPNLSELYRCVVDNRRNFGDLFRRQAEISTEPSLHARGDLLGIMKSKERMLGVQPTEERATNSPGNKYKDESPNQFPFQCLVHCENSS